MESKSRRNFICAASDISGQQLAQSASTGPTTASDFQDSELKANNKNLNDQIVALCLSHKKDGHLPDELYSLMHVWELQYNWAPITPADANISLQPPGQRTYRSGDLSTHTLDLSSRQVERLDMEVRLSLGVEL